MANTTPNHDYNTPARGTSDWHLPANANFENLDTDIEVRDVVGSRGTYSAKDGAKFLATDTGEVYLGDGSAWNLLGSLVPGPPDTYGRLDQPESTSARWSFESLGFTDTDADTNTFYIHEATSGLLSVESSTGTQALTADHTGTVNAPNGLQSGGGAVATESWVGANYAASGHSHALVGGNISAGGTPAADDVLRYNGTSHVWSSVSEFDPAANETITGSWTFNPSDASKTTFETGLDANGSILGTSIELTADPAFNIGTMADAETHLNTAGVADETSFAIQHLDDANSFPTISWSRDASASPGEALRVTNVSTGAELLRVYDGGVVAAASGELKDQNGWMKDYIQDKIDSPNIGGSFTLAANGAANEEDQYRHPVPIPSGQTLTVYGWGCQASDGTQPTGLQINLVQPDGATVVTSASASSTGGWTSNTAGITSYTNGGTGFQTAYIEVDNDTTNEYTLSGYGAIVEMYAAIVVEA